MKITLLLFMACLLMAQLTYSQKIYPRKIVLDSDTLCLITIEQVKQVNLAYVDLHQALQMNNFWKNRIASLDRMASLKDKGIASMRKELAYRDSIETNLYVMLDQRSEQVKVAESNKGWLKTSRGILAGIVLVLAGALIVK